MLHPLVHDDAGFGLALLGLLHFGLRVSVAILIILFLGRHGNAASLQL